MATFLFVVPPLHGHTNPTISVGAELRSRGHRVVWCGYPSFLAPLLDEGAEIAPVGEDLPSEVVEGISERSRGLRGAAALKFLWEDFLHPLAEAMVPGVERALEAVAPDLVIVDQQTFAGALVALRAGVPWVTSATTSAELVDAFEGLPRLREWVDEALVRFQTDHRVPPGEATPGALRFSERGIVAFSTPDLVGPTSLPEVDVAWVGPAFTRPGVEPFDEDLLDGRPLVFVSLGTVNAAAGERFFTEAVAALGARPHLQGVVVAPPELIPDPPDNVVVAARVPQVRLLGRTRVAVSHGGHNTVCEALAHGVPLLLAPIRDDQPVVADQVVRAGAGLRVKFARVRSAELGEGIDRLLSEPRFAAAAALIGESFRAAGGASAAADALEGWAGTDGVAARAGGDGVTGRGGSAEAKALPKGSNP